MAGQEVPIKRRIAIIGSSRYPIAQPFAGGLEAHVWGLTRALRARGADVVLFAAPGSDPDLGAELLPVDAVTLSVRARQDVSMPAELTMSEHHAYLSLMLGLSRGDGGFDLVHNHSLHYLPVAMASSLPMPMVSTLHTPPTPWLESAIAIGRARNVTFAAVSAHTAHAWRDVAEGIHVVPNGVDLGLWPMGRGGGPLVWSGRLVPEKGAHLAIEAARLAGAELTLAGPIVDRDYFDACVASQLDDRIRYVGHLAQPELARLVGAASAALVTPQWDEPYGLIVAEALASGTPVVAFARGGIPEIVDASCAVLIAPDDVPALAAAIPVASALERAAARRRAEEHCSLDQMLAGYERLYDRVSP